MIDKILRMIKFRRFSYRMGFLLIISLFLLLCYLIIELVMLSESVPRISDYYRTPSEVIDNQIEIREKEIKKRKDIVEDATFFTICRNSDLNGIKDSIKTLESHFNKDYHYPWVFANDEPFSEGFKDEISKAVSGNVIFTVIPKEYWDVPDFIDKNFLTEQLEQFERDNVMYGGNLSYRKMCRFNSGFFYKLKALSKYNWYWRVEPDVKYTCNLPDDPFKTMVNENKVYGFVLAMTEDKRTVRKLWKESRHYFENLDRWKNVNVNLEEENDNSNNNNNTISDGERYESITNTSLGFIEQNTDSNELVRGEFNYCHYWSNFEIGNLNFFRNPEYDNYFKTLDKTGNFFYERWGDAPVHTIAISYLLTPEQIKYFDNTGYYHEKIGNCPRDRSLYKKLQCSCPRYREFSWHKSSCVPRWFKGLRKELPHDVHW